MFFVIVGVGLILLNLAGIGPMGLWNWEITGDLWKMVLPFILAVLWWWWADATGYTKRKVIERENVKKKARIEKSREAMGMGTKKRR